MERPVNIHSPHFPDLHIACCTDVNYFTHTVATIASVLENHPHRIVHIHLIAEGVDPKDLAKLRLAIGAHNGLLYLYTPPADAAQRFRVHSSPRLSTAAYYRCFLADLLPRELERVLYLDGDVIVRKPLDAFYDRPLGNWAVAAVKDYGNITAKDFERLHIPEAHGYFNSGVLLLALEQWRKDDVLAQCTAYFAAHPERIVYDDQDLLNAVLSGKVDFVAPTWNAQDFFFRKRFAPAEAALSEAEFAELLTDPAVVHFTRVPKPWHWKCTHPFRKDYLRYLKSTPWRKQDESHALSSKAKHQIRVLLTQCHLVKAQFRRKGKR